MSARLVSAMNAFLALAVAPAHATPEPPGSRPVERPPVERDCARLEETRLGLPPRGEPRDRAPLGAFVDRVPNADPAQMPTPWHPVSLERLHCEQLNVKDKLDYLIRRLAR